MLGIDEVGLFEYASYCCPIDGREKVYMDDVVLTDISS
jgi:hypothetical protein